VVRYVVDPLRELHQLMGRRQPYRTSRWINGWSGC